MKLFSSITTLGLASVTALGQATIQPRVVDSAGGQSRSGTFALQTSIGQAVGGASSASSVFTIRSGFVNALGSAGPEKPLGDFYVSALSLDGVEEQPVPVGLKGSKPGMVFTVKTQPLNGSLAGTPPDLTYQPKPDFFGEDFFTYTGSRDGEETAEAVVTINVAGVNDPPTIAPSARLDGSGEDTDTVIHYGGLLSASGAKDVEGLDVTFRIEGVKVGELRTGDFEKVVEGQTVVRRGDKGLVWTPPEHLNGDVGAFTIRASDGELFSPVSEVVLVVAPAPDAPVVANPLADVEVDKDSAPVVIDLAPVFFDPDNDPVKYFVKEVDDKALAEGEIIDGSRLQLTLARGMSGETDVIVGFEANAQIVYNTFKLIIRNVVDSNPHVVREYWKGISEDFGDIELPAPLHYWSFENVDAIEKTALANWKFKADEEPLQAVLTTPNLLSSAGNWSRTYFARDRSSRVQGGNYFTFGPDLRNREGKPMETLSQYTLIVDVRTQYGHPNAILNTVRGANKDRAEVWLNAAGAVGGQREYSPVGSMKPNLWYRFIYIVDLEEGTRRYFVDFMEVLSQEVPEDQKDRHKIGPVGFRIGFDTLARNKNYEIKKVVLFDYAFDDEQAEFIGFNGYEEYGEEQHKSDDSEAVLSLISPSSSDDEWISKPGIILYSNSPTSASWIIQQSRDLLIWEQAGQIEVEATDETGGVGFLEIETLFDDASMFYRAKASE